MSAVSTSSVRSSNKRPSISSSSSRHSTHRDQKLLLRADSDFDETASVASSVSSRSFASGYSSCSQGSRQRAGTLGSLATSCVSLRDLELRKNQIEQELARVQHELQLRESQQRDPVAAGKMGLKNPTK